MMIHSNNNDSRKSDDGFWLVDDVGWKTTTTMQSSSSQSAFALEIQKPWVDLLRNGLKRIDVRAYPLPPALLNQKIYILESLSSSSSSPCGNEKIVVATTTTATSCSTLGNRIQLHGNDDDDDDCGGDAVVSPSSSPTIVGWCIFSSVKVYDNAQDFLLDEQYHKVPASSPFGWADNNNKTVVLYGWMIDQVGFEHSDIPQKVKTATLQRRMRSLFQIQ